MSVLLGKSTLLNLIAGLDRPTQGSLRIFERDLAQMSGEELSLHRRRNVGIIFQSFNLVPTMTARENITLAMMFAGMPRAERDAARECLLSLDMATRIDAANPQGCRGPDQEKGVLRLLVERCPAGSQTRLHHSRYCPEFDWLDRAGRFISWHHEHDGDVAPMSTFRIKEGRRAISFPCLSG